MRIDILRISIFVDPATVVDLAAVTLIRPRDSGDKVVTLTIVSSFIVFR